MTQIHARRRTVSITEGKSRVCGQPMGVKALPPCITPRGGRANLHQMPPRHPSVARAGGVAVRKADAAGMLPRQPTPGQAAHKMSAGSIGTPANFRWARHAHSIPQIEG